MTSPVWRSLVIGTGCRITYTEGQMTVQKKDGTEESIPLFDVQAVMISSEQTTLTARLICELQKRHIRVIFCDEKKLPYGEVVGYYHHHAAAERIREQIAWKKEHCCEIWRVIVFQKVEMQRKLLRFLHLKYAESSWQRYLESIQSGDRSNREGQAARLYFNALFGKGFQRRVNSDINSGLNYGYAILCSAMTRTLVFHGYHPSLGIHHCGKTNSLNFTYDLIEPFRPFVDRIVWEFHGSPLDRKLRHALIDVTNVEMRYGGQRMAVFSAMDHYILEITCALKQETIPQFLMEFER